MKSGNLNFLEHSGSLQACNGTAVPLPILEETGWAMGPENNPLEGLDSRPSTP
jgi:hypothetical protein